MARDIKHLADDLEKVFKNLIDEKMLLGFAEKMKEIIYKRTKSGKGLTSDAVEVGVAGLKALNALNKEYVEWRKTQTLGPFGKANRSNLTLTGQLLESIVARVVGGVASIEIPNSKRIGSKLTNKQVAEWVTKNGRPFFNLSKNELKQLDAYVSREIRKRIREVNRR